MARRRRNPSPLKFGEILPTLILVGVAYWLYRTFSKAGADISRGGSELWNLLTTGPTSNVNSVMLPTGEVITVDAIVAEGSGIDGQGNFNWYAVPYQISGTDPTTGMYVAKRIVT
jgi:hypothetical protein